MGRIVLLAIAAVASGCTLVSAPDREVADLRGTWRLTGNQVSPIATIDGTLAITAQRSGEVSGTALWQETDGAGAVQGVAGPVSGRVIGTEGVDFEVQLAGVARRHAGRVVADTIVGVWLDAPAGASGEFRAVRTVGP